VPCDAAGAVVVIGASRGFGASLALALLARGHDVNAVYSSSSAAASELQRSAGASSERLVLHRADVRDEAAVQGLVDRITGNGTPVRGLILNAASVPLGMALTAESAREVAEYVADAVRLAAIPLGAFLPALDRDRGWVVFCSSSAVTVPPRDWPHYVAAKGALEGLASWVARNEPRLRTVVLRPPKMLTDLTNSPSGRIAAAAPDAVAAWVVAQLARDQLEPGLTTLEPSAEEIRAP
jgi:NAD(P)-dependent dehydrogenase (short-subunit alcohol dehydrogenase family)